jgi:hypothetical protein
VEVEVALQEHHLVELELKLLVALVVLEVEQEQTILAAHQLVVAEL